MGLYEENPTVMEGFLARKSVMWIIDILFVVNPSEMVEQAAKLPLIWDAMTFMWRHGNDLDTPMIHFSSTPVPHMHGTEHAVFAEICAQWPD